MHRVGYSSYTSRYTVKQTYNYRRNIWCNTRYYPFTTKNIRKLVYASLGTVYNTQCDMSVCLIDKIYTYYQKFKCKCSLCFAESFSNYELRVFVL